MMLEEKVKYDPSECRKTILKMARTITAMKDSFDDSMRGVFLDIFVSNYVSEKGNLFCEMFDYIMEHQKEKYDSYGDIDQSVTKMKVKNFKSLKNEKDDKYSLTGMYLNDIFCDNKFAIIKVVQTPVSEIKEIVLRFSKTEYHVRKVSKEIKTIDFDKLVKYGDFRDDGYAATFDINPFENPAIMRLKEDRGMAYLYKDFKDAYDAISNPYYELKSKQK